MSLKRCVWCTLSRFRVNLTGTKILWLNLAWFLLLEIGAHAPTYAKDGPTEASGAGPGRPGKEVTKAVESSAIKLELQASQMEWTKVCAVDNLTKKDTCYTIRDFGDDPAKPPIITLSVFDIKGEETKIIRLLLPFTLLLRANFTVKIDNGEALDGNYEICFPNGCFGDVRTQQATIEAMKKGTSVTIAARNQINAELNFVVPLKGFGAAYDGNPLNPEELKAAEEKLKRELQQRIQNERMKKQSLPGIGN